MEAYSSDTIAELCLRVEQALKDLPGPDRTSREAFFATDSLWRMEVRFTCDQAIEYVRAIILLLDQGLTRPAAALSRSIHECFVRFEYLLDHEDQLCGWFKRQISRDYHSAHDRWRYDTGLSAADNQGLQEDMKIMEALLGEVPIKPGDQWKSTGSMLEDISRNLRAGFHLQMRRHLIAYPSEYVHIRVSSCSPPGPIIGLSAISFSEIVRKAMQLCTDKRMIDLPAGEIGALCRKVLSDTAPR